MNSWVLFLGCSLLESLIVWDPFAFVSDVGGRSPGVGLLRATGGEPLRAIYGYIIQRGMCDERAPLTPLRSVNFAGPAARQQERAPVWLGRRF